MAIDHQEGGWTNQKWRCLMRYDGIEWDINLYIYIYTYTVYIYKS